MRYLVFLCLLTMNTLHQNFAQEAMIIAHRGASYIAPENTLAAAKLGWELGADAVEVDVYITSDQEIVAIHDKTTKRTTNKNLVVAETDLATLQSLDAGSWKSAEFAGEPIPTLKTLLDHIPYGKKLVIEIKCGVEIMEPLKKLISAHDRPEQIVFIAFDWEVILATKKHFPHIPSYWLSGKKEDIVEKWSLVMKYGLDGINLHHRVIDRALMDNAKKDGMTVLSWTINDFELAQKLNRLGVVGITTDRPGFIRSEFIKSANQP